MACKSCKGFNIVIENGFDNPSLLLTEGVNSTALQNQLKPMFSAALAEMTSVSYSHFAKVKNINLDKAWADKLKPIVEKYIKKIVEKDYLANLITKSVDKSNLTLKDIEPKKENLQQIKQELIKAKIEIDKKSNEVASVLKYVTFLFSVLAPGSAANLAQIGIATNLVKSSKPTSKIPRMTQTPSGAEIIRRNGVDLIRDPVTGEMRPPRPEDFESPVEAGVALRPMQEEIRIPLYNKILLNEMPHEAWDQYYATRDMTPEEKKQFLKGEREGVKYFNDFMGVIDPIGFFDGMNVVLYAEDYARATDQKKKDEALLYGLFSLIGALVPYAGDLVIKPFKFGWKIGKKTPTQAIKDLIEFVQKYTPKLLEGLGKLISKAPKKVKEFYNRLLSLIKDPNKIQKIAKVGTKGVGYANRAAAEATELFVRRWSTLTSKQVGTQVAIYSALYIEKVRELFEAALTLPVEVLTKMISLANDAKSLDEIIEQIVQTRLLDNHQIVKNILIKLYELAEVKSREQEDEEDLGKSADKPLQENNKAIKIRILENKAVVLNENRAIKSLVDDFLVAIKNLASEPAVLRALKIQELFKGPKWKDIIKYTGAADYSTFITRMRSAGIVTRKQAVNELSHLITQLKAARNAIPDVGQIEIDKAFRRNSISTNSASFNEASEKYKAISDVLNGPKRPPDGSEELKGLRTELKNAEDARKLARDNLKRAQKELAALESLENNKKVIQDQINSLEDRKKQLLSGGKATDDAAKTATKTTDDAAKAVAKNAKKGSFWKKAGVKILQASVLGSLSYVAAKIVCRVFAEAYVSLIIADKTMNSDTIRWIREKLVSKIEDIKETIRIIFIGGAAAGASLASRFGILGASIVWGISSFFGCAKGGTERLSVTFAAGLTKTGVPQTMNEITRRMVADAGIPEGELDGALYTLTERPDVFSWQFVGTTALSVIPFVEQDYGSIANSLIRKTDIADYTKRVIIGGVGLLFTDEEKIKKLDADTQQKISKFIEDAIQQKTFLPPQTIQQIKITKQYLEKNGLRDRTLQSEFIKCLYAEYTSKIAESATEKAKEGLEDIQVTFDALGISKEGIEDSNKAVGKINKVISAGLEVFEDIEKKYNEADKKIQNGLEALGFRNPIRTYLEAAKNYVKDGDYASTIKEKNFMLTYEKAIEYLDKEIAHYEKEYNADTPEKKKYKDNNIAYYKAMKERLEALHQGVENKKIKNPEDIENKKPTYSCKEIRTNYKALWDKSMRLFNISKGIDFKPGDEVQRISDGEYYDVVSVNAEERTMNLSDEKTKLENQKFSNYIISYKKPEEGK